MKVDNNLKLSKEELEKYLSSLYDKRVELQRVWRLGEEHPADVAEMKGFGYGFPYVLEFKVQDRVKRAVLETMRPEGFGHDHFSDRAQILLWQNSAFSQLPRHVRSIDVGAFATDDKCLQSLGKCSEFFLLTEFAEGKLYHNDLDRIKVTGQANESDRQRCLALSNYLAEIHSVKRDAPWLYVRRVRELVGHGECIMGLLDSYPPKLNLFGESFLVDIERDCVAWRWRLKTRTNRLAQVHGDFHPWNVLFREGTDFTVLDRSRGEWGEPADDLAAMSINYIFYSLQKYGKLTGAFEELFSLFWNDYLDKTGDKEMFAVVQPFYAWRGLVVASPIWYPTLDENVRVKLLNFVRNVLNVDNFDTRQINSYMRPQKND